MRIFIDCEFNSAEGGLISMGMISEDGQRTFYEVVDVTEAIDPWVKENVMPILEKEPIPFKEFQRKLRVFLSQFPKVHIIADHPADIIRICRAMIVSGGEFMEIPVTFEVDHQLSAKQSKVLHNAFHDAVAIRESWFKVNGYLHEVE